MLERAVRSVKVWIWSHPRIWSIARRGRLLVRYLLRRPHESDFAVFGLLPERNGLFLDVGANSGQSALSFRLFNRRSPILSVEPLDAHESDLRLVARLVGKFDYMICAASDRNGEMTIFVPVYKGTPLTSQASLSRERAANCHWVRVNSAWLPRDAIHVEARRVLVRRLDDLGLQPAFVKIDVEGAAEQVIRGLSETIRRHQPLLLIEPSGALNDLLSLDALAGYRAHTYRAETGRLGPFDPTSGRNLVLAPAALEAQGLA